MVTPEHSDTAASQRSVRPTETLETYRSLRIGMVAAGLLLTLSVVLHIVAVGAIPGSISATFYTPVRSVFVSSLVAVGLALVAIKGRSGWENGLLDLAGGVIPLVAFVPTPVRVSSVRGATEVFTCPDPLQSCVPVEVRDGVGNNVAAYGWVIFGALACTWWFSLRASRRGVGWSRLTRRGIVVATLTWAGMGAWFMVGRESFLQYAHYASATVFFALLIAVVWLNGWYSDPTSTRPDLPGSSQRTYRRRYYEIAIVMALAVVAGLVLFLATGQPNSIPVVFWLEVALLVLFMAFWILQTTQHWNTAVPDTPSRTARTAPKPTEGSN